MNRWTVNLYDAAGEVVSSADFDTELEAEECRDDLEQLAQAAGGRVEVVTPEGEAKR